MNEASYISLLDMQRVMQRVLKRSGLPVWHTLGFNPHIYMTFACPLSLGQESQCECVDVKTEAENPDFAQWQTALNAIMPAGIEVYRVEPVKMKADAIAYACYRIRYPADAAEKLAQYNALDSVPVEKKSKRGVRMVEMKEYVPTLELETEGESVSFAVCLPASQDLNLNPSLLTAALGVAMYAMFISLLAPSVRGNGRLGLLVLLTAAVNTLLSRFLDSGWALIASTLAGAAAGVFFVELPKEEDADAD